MRNTVIDYEEGVETMKKAFLILTLVAVLFNLFACGQEVVVHYNNVSDFSDTQGYRNWYYLYADYDIYDAKQMIYDTANGNWRGEDFFCHISVDSVHPGANMETIIAWTAPKDGIVEYDCLVRRTPSDPNGVGADGVYVYIAKTDTEDYLDSMTLRSNDLDEHELSGSAEVKKGQTLYFVTNFQSNYYFDQTKWVIDIAHTTTEDSETVFAPGVAALCLAGASAVFLIAAILIRKRRQRI